MDVQKHDSMFIINIFIFHGYVFDYNIDISCWNYDFVYRKIS